MKYLPKLFLLTACIPSLIAGPATAKSDKGADNKASDKASEAKPVPPGILVAAQHASPKVGHGSDVPKGKGYGWGHLFHDHEDTPTSP